MQKTETELRAKIDALVIYWREYDRNNALDCADELEELCASGRLPEDCEYGGEGG